MDTQAILALTKGELQNPDAIIDPYDLTFLWVSKKCCELSGYTEKELIGKQIFVTCPKYKDPTEMEVNMQSDPPKERLIPIIKKDGKKITFKIKSVAVKMGDSPYHVGEILEVLQ